MILPKTYSELIAIPSYVERYKYLRIGGQVGVETFGPNRHINQAFYSSQEWACFRDEIIIRDMGCDLAFPMFDIHGPIYIHHINPITVEDIINCNVFKLLNPENAICTAFNTHQAIHYGDMSLLPLDFITERTPNDTCPWRT